MNGRIHLVTCLLVLTGLCLVIEMLPAGQTDSHNIPREKMLSTAREIMNASHYCALITLDESGRADARTMDAFPPEEDMTVWFGTNPRTRKVREIGRNPHVTLYYFDPKGLAYVTLLGTARLVNDPKEKKTRWKDAWKEFYPNRDTDYMLIEVKPERLEVVSPKLGGTSTADWAPPSIQLPPPHSKR
jgi:general stress protein 26